jgi:tetratricopeptide (TPR) repeat protein
MLPSDIKRLENVLTWRQESQQKARAVVYPSDLHKLRKHIATTPDDELLAVLETLLDAAHKELDREPRRACTYTGIVLAHVERVRVPSGAEPFLDLLRAQAWKERANALQATGDSHNALIATQRGIGALAANPAYAMERADLELLEAYIHHVQGDRDTALARVRTSAAQFRAHGDARRALRARTTEAVLLYELRRFPEAEEVFRALYEEAERTHDEETHARIANNLGHCAIERSDNAAARRYFTTALVGFDALRMDAERPRVLWGFARIATKDNQVREAIAQLTAVQADFLNRGMVIDGALVGLAILELLVTIDRVALLPSVCTDLVNTFRNAGMQENALRAFSFLQDHAQSHTVTPAHLQRVRTFVRSLAERPLATFAA